MSLRDCLSIMELQEFKREGEGRAADHLRECARCRALLRELPEISEQELSALSLNAVATTFAIRRDVTGAERPVSGQIWRAAVSPDAPWSQLVAVVGRSRVEPGLVMVIPVSEEVENGTDLDLRIDPDRLGYEAMLLAWNYGGLLEEQLLEHVGVLSDVECENTIALYRWLVGGGEQPDVPVAGPPLAGPDDERSWFRSEELDRFLELRVPASQEPEGNEVEDEGQETTPVEALGVGAGSATVVPFSEFLRRRLESNEWDANSLLSRTGLERAQLDDFLGDNLELTTASDARALALVLRELEWTPEELEPQIRRSLTLSPGGEAAAESWGKRVAARARAHVPGHQRDKDLFSGAPVDASKPARDRAIERYWQRLLECYEMLSP